MPPVLEVGREFLLVDRTQGYTGGRTATISLTTIPAEFSIHSGISYVQSFSGYPVGAASGVSAFTPVVGPPVILANPEDWRALVYGRLSGFTRSFFVAHGEARLWSFFFVWG